MSLGEGSKNNALNNIDLVTRYGSGGRTLVTNVIKEEINMHFTTTQAQIKNWTLNIKYRFFCVFTDRGTLLKLCFHIV